MCGLLKIVGEQVKPGGEVTSLTYLPTYLLTYLPTYLLAYLLIVGEQVKPGGEGRGIFVQVWPHRAYIHNIHNIHT